MKRASIITLSIVALTACSSSDSDVEAVDAASGSSTTTSEPAVSSTSTMAAATTTTLEPECRGSETRFGDDGRERCENGQWAPWPVPTAAPTSSTSSTTTTTVSPGAEADLVALLLLGNLQDPEDPGMIDALVGLVEPYPLDRVDVITSRYDNEGEAWIVIAATSGYSTEEVQLEAAVDGFVSLTELWAIEPLSEVESVLVGLDYTVDGRQFLVPYDVIRDVVLRRVSPEDALGL